MFKNLFPINEKDDEIYNVDFPGKREQFCSYFIHLVLVFHFFELIPQISKCWSCLRVFLPAFHHNCIPIIGKISRDFTCVMKHDNLMFITSSLFGIRIKRTGF